MNINQLRPSPDTEDRHDVLVAHGNVIRYFVTRALGVDTLARVGELRFYQNHVDWLDRALATFDEQDTHFLVFGRLDDGHFITLDDLQIPAALEARCTSVPEQSYRNDASSSAIRMNPT